MDESVVFTMIRLPQLWNMYREKKKGRSYLLKEVFIVEEMPSFQREDAFREYIAKNLRYPKIAADNGIWQGVCSVCHKPKGRWISKNRRGSCS
jgi:hypothetical protein